MHTSTLRPPCSSPSSPSEFFLASKASSFFNPRRIVEKPRNVKPGRPVLFAYLKCAQNSETSVSEPVSNGFSSSFSCLAISEAAPPVRAVSVAEKVKCVASEFKSLVEPIDRVKRLLHYATILPPFDDSAKIKQNRVKGCTAQVWLEVKLDADGLMRFSVDSDSEITKGFCSCLIWVLDGGSPEEVLSVNIDDLFEMNVGMPSRGNSRVNTWHNVLISMQKRTKDVILERDQNLPLDSFSSFFVRTNGVSVNGRYKESSGLSTSKNSCSSVD